MSATGTARRLRGWSAAVVALVAIGLASVAFIQNRAVAHDLLWPGFDVQYRELASAQTLLDQGYGPDADYAHEHVWYNPMAAWIIAGASRISGAPAATVINRIGPYLNLAAPAALFLLTTVLFDGFAAVATLGVFVFIIGTEFAFYDSAAYSPWFAPESFGQAWLYLLLAAAYRAFRPAASFAWSVACGALLGLAFLTHTAPALLGGAVIITLVALDIRKPDRSGGALARAVVALGVAFLVSLPFGFEILWLYHLKIVNEFPSLSPSNLLDLNELPGLAATIAMPVTIAAIALALRAKKHLDPGLRVLLVLFGVIAALLTAHVVRLLLGKAGVHLPPIVAALHFFFYFMAVVAIGIGVGIRDASSAIVSWLARGRRMPFNDGAIAGGLLTCAVTVLLVAAAYPRYLQRQDFTNVRKEAVALNQRFPVDVVAWIRAHSSPDDVFLCTDDASLYIVPPAGRKVVATNRYFSNPYVDWATRDRDRTRMFEQLKQRDIDGFRALAARYHVRFVLLTRDKSPDWLRSAGLWPKDLPDVEPASLSGLPEFALVFETERFAILAVRSASAEPQTWAASPAPR